MTGRELLSASLRLIGALAPGESLAASVATDGLASINRMLDSWSNEALMLYSVVREEFLLTASDQSYSMGDGGDFDTDRPVEIESASIKIGSGSSSIEYEMTILSASEWAAIIQKEMSTSIPQFIYIDHGSPLATINIYPKPTTVYYLVLYSTKQLSEIALDAEVTLPPGYEEAIVYNGAKRLAPEFGRVVPAEVSEIAIESKANIKRKNHESSYLRVDNALITTKKFNFLAGDY